MKAKRHVGPSELVEQGSRVLARVCGRPAILVSSRKANGIVAVESALEKTVVQLADLDPRVVELKPQPFTLDIFSGERFLTPVEQKEARAKRKGAGRLSLYTPDFMLRLSNGEVLILEVKHDRFPGDLEYQHKLAQAAEVLRSQGYLFVRLDINSDPLSALTANAQILGTRPLNGTDILPRAVCDAVEEALAKSPLPISLLLSRAGIERQTIPVLFRTGLIAGPLSTEQITTRMVVYWSGGDLSALELLNLGKHIQ